MPSFITDAVPITHAPDACFLCGVRLTATTRTEEHVFPEWLLRMFDLWNERFTLPTGQLRQYRSIRIPCCSPCNNEDLSRLEARVHRAVDDRYAAFARLPKLFVFQWLSKILYEVMYLDASYFADPAKRDLGHIRDPEDLQRFRTFFEFLQSVRLNVRFQRGAVPWSIFVFRTKTYATPRECFDYADNPELLTIALRMHDIGVVACLEDSGAVQEAMTPFFQKLRRHPVDSAQFQEVVARTFYATHLRTAVPAYIRMGSDPTTVITVPPSKLSAGPPVGPWVFRDYAMWLHRYTRIPYDECQRPSGTVVE